MTIPTLQTPARNLGWSVKKTPLTSTAVLPHVSGREVRVRNWVNPLYRFELTFTGLASNADYPGLGRDSLQQLMGLFNQVGGQSDTFLFTDPTDCRAINQPLGTGDGVKTAWPFVRALNNQAPEPVGFVTAVTAAYLYFGGSPQVGNWNLVNPSAAQPFPLLQWNAAPAAGVRVSADFNFAFVCRFEDDNVEFEQFMSNLWQCTTVKFRSVRNGGF